MALRQFKWVRGERGETRKIPILRPGSKTKQAIRDREVMVRIDRAARALGNEVWATVTVYRRTGMHGSSLCGLRPSSVSGGVLSWTRPKTGRRMAIRVDAELGTALAVLFAEGPRSYDLYYHRVRQAGRHAGVRGLSPMTFRHTRAVSLLVRGVSPVKVCQVLGCSMEVLLRHYGVMSDEELLEAG